MALLSSDDTKLFIAEHLCDVASAAMVLVHGLGEHSGRYDHVCDFFNKAGISVYAYDQRGHGRSEGKRGYVPDFQSLLTDLDMVLGHVRLENPDIPLFLYGHSMGGCVVLSYLIHHNPNLSGVVVTGAFIKLALKPNPFVLALGKLMNKIYPAFTQSNQVNPNFISRDKNVVNAYIADPLVHNKLSSALGIALLEQGEMLSEYKGKIAVPLLLNHGTADHLTSAEGSIIFAKNTSGEIKLKLWEGLYHEIHNEPEKYEVLDYTLNWMKNYF
jgi:alpha-beta hydrolase superfamily lysophospholipase